jgi:hypothetical protein
VADTPCCPTCGYLMCEQFREDPINEVASYAVPLGTFICYTCSGEKGKAVECNACSLVKAPRGRSVPDAMANSRCNFECPGYYLDPKPGDLWPGESRADFGYPKVPPKFPSPSTPPGTPRGSR